MRRWNEEGCFKVGEHILEKSIDQRLDGSKKKGSWG